MKLIELTDAMKRHDAYAAPGSESDQWALFCQEVINEYGVMPFDDAAADITVDDNFAEYWTAVAEGDYAEAGRIGEVPDEWLDGGES